MFYDVKRNANNLIIQFEVHTAAKEDAFQAADISNSVTGLRQLQMRSILIKWF